MDGPASPCCLKDLPQDVLVEVFYQLSSRTLTSTSLVCRYFHILVQTPSLWKKLCTSTFGLTFRDNKELCDRTSSCGWKEVFKDLCIKSSLAASIFPPKGNYCGCQHYTRNCQIRARCCYEFFPCRLCHDMACNHTIDRFATDTMMCMKCLCVQAVGKFCTSCKTEIAPYYCSHCKLWSSLEKGPIYHCDKCGICRQGKGLGIDNWHCDNCGICLSLSMKATHECQIKDGLKVKCPLCPSSQLLFFSREPVTVLQCGHASHVKCLQERLQQNLPADELPCLPCDIRRRQQEHRHSQQGQIILYQSSVPRSPLPHDKVASCNVATCSQNN